MAVAAFGLAAGLLGGPGASPAAAADLPPLFDEPLTLDVTNTAIFDYHFDNRNTPATRQVEAERAARRSLR